MPRQKIVHSGRLRREDAYRPFRTKADEHADGG